MKKVVICAFFLALILPSAFAYVGVRPASYEIDFEPNLKRVFTFTFLGDEDANFKVYSEGPFSEYVSLSKETLAGGGSVNALLQLPAYADEPGRHRLLIGANQVPGETGGAVGIVGNVRGVIFINVPYPGKYAELEFSASNANIGEDVDMTLKIYSKGDENITTYSRIDIYDSSDNFIESIDLGENFVQSAKNVELATKLSTSSYVSGDYKAVAIVEYGGETAAESEKIFRLGRLFVDIFSHTEEVEREKINKFNIEAESFWNEEIGGLYANVSIVGYPALDFLTPSASINPWSKTTLSGFFDTSEITEDEFTAVVRLHYEGEVTEKEAELKFIRDEASYIVYGIIAGSLLVILILVGVVVWIIIRRKTKSKK